MAGVKHVTRRRKKAYETIEVATEKILHKISGLKLILKHTYSRRYKNILSNNIHDLEKPKIIKETNINQRITIYLGLVVYHLVMSYLYASLAGEWMG
ncbi:MAG: hypothetical protein D6732_17355 [Methanobacteriota archaeon]|nr:MAG: hypothetical protein D6732_17355 [Euryarchaeota archaeon]